MSPANSPSAARYYRAKAKAKPMPADDPRHGTANGYQNQGCRCERCTAANTQAQRDFIQNRLARIRGVE